MDNKYNHGQGFIVILLALSALVLAQIYISIAGISALQRERQLEQESQERLQLRYRVQPGKVFETRITAEGNIVTEIFRPDGVQEIEKLVNFEVVTRQIVESAVEPDILVIRIEPIAETLSYLIDGRPHEINLDLLPTTILRMTRLGEIEEVQYSIPQNRILLDSEILDFTSISYVFPKFPEEPIEIGSSWQLIPAEPETEFEGVANLLGIEEIMGNPCALIHMESSMPINFTSERERELLEKGLRIQGRVERNIQQYVALESGWPLSGNGRISYDLLLFRDGDRQSHTTINFNISFNAMF